MEKDIRFVEKKVDEAWKSQADRDKGAAKEPAVEPSPKTKAEEAPSKSQETSQQTSQPFMNLISSLVYQAMMHMGTNPSDPAAESESEVNLEAAKEMIELLIAIQKKTAGNLSAEEKQLLQTILSELQMKFAELS